jgi:hypothetical protein
MSVQPFRIARPLQRILHNTLLQRIDEVDRTFSLNDIDTLGVYSSADLVKHEEMCAALTKRFDAVHSRGDAVFSGDGLVFPLRSARRAISSIQRFPNTDSALEAAKKATEVVVLRDVLRLSRDDVSSKDITSLWSLAFQLSQWGNIEELLRHFPLKETLSSLSEREHRELVGWACQCTHTTPQGGSTAGPAVQQTEIVHVQRFLTDILGIEEVTARLRRALAGGSADAACGDVTQEVWSRENRIAYALTCTMLAATLRKTCGVTDSFPVSEEEWAQWCGATLSSPDRAVSPTPSHLAGAESGVLSPSSDGTRGSAGITVKSISLSAWSRRLLAVHDPAVPPYARDVLVARLTSDLQSIYRTRDAHMAVAFFYTILPAMCSANAAVDLRRHVQECHSRMMQEVFWMPTSTPSTSSSTPGKRGRWTSSKVLGPGVDGTAAAPAAASFHLSMETALNILVGETCLFDQGEPPVAAHVPAIAAMLRTVLSHLRPHLRGAMGRIARGKEGPTPEQLQRLLWNVWQTPQTTSLAVVLSRLMKAGAHSRGSGSGDTGLGAHPELDSLVAEGLEMLRVLLTVKMLEECGTASLLSTLLTFCQEVMEALGGTTYVARLRALAVEHAMDGFSRAGLKAMAEAAVQHSRSGSEAERERAIEFARQLEAAQLRLPLRIWSKGVDP